MKDSPRFILPPSSILLGLPMPRYLRNLIIALIVIAVLFGLDFVFQGRDDQSLLRRILMLSGIAITLAVSLNLINGFTGQFLDRSCRLHGCRRLFVGLLLRQLRSEPRELHWAAESSVGLVALAVTTLIGALLPVLPV